MPNRRLIVGVRLAYPNELRTSGMNFVLLERGAEPVAGTPEEFGAFIRSETVRLKKMIELADIQAK